MPTQPDQLATLGVGRIPLESLGDASVFFVRGLLRERLLAHRPPRLLMVANSGVMRRALPLCETISRVTAAEFKNFGVHVDEFYGKLTDSPEILTAARSANLILYEGHLSYQDLIDAPVLKRSQAEDYPLDEEDLEGFGGSEACRRSRRGSHAGPAGRDGRAHVPASARPLGGTSHRRLAELRIAGRRRALAFGRVGRSGLDRQHDADPQRLRQRPAERGDELDAVSRRHAGRNAPRRRELHVLRRRTEGPPRAQGKGQGSSRGVEFPALGRSRVAGPAESAGRAAASARPGGVGRRRHVANRRARVAASRGPQREIRGQHVSQQPGRGAAEDRGGRDDEEDLAVLLLLPAAAGEPWPAATSTELEPSRSDAKRVDARIDRSRGLLYLVYYPEQENPGESVVLHLKAVPAAEQARRLSK